MGWGFRKSFKILPGVRVNVGKRGISTSVGPRGASVNVGRQGTHVNTGVPGTGLRYRSRLGSISTPVIAAGVIAIGVLVFVGLCGLMVFTGRGPANPPPSKPVRLAAQPSPTLSPSPIPKPKPNKRSK